MSEDTIYYRRRLPHIHPNYAALFITFRNNDDLPPYLLSQYLKLTQELKLQALKSDNPKEEKHQNRKKSFAEYDKMLHKSDVKLNLLKNPEVARAIADTIHELAETHYQLFAYTIMPNHVHLLIKPHKLDEDMVEVKKIMQLLKGRSARKANLILGRSGSLWGREYFDHFPRDSREFDGIVNYILENPVKAGLTGYEDEWEWSWVNM